ncbi:MAG: 50S ribosome-binding GTPase [Gammaproteobacteria bacterium]|nr:50S ribosome-binding GTPase [Gammaproteobacteria bacterium]
MDIDWLSRLVDYWRTQWQLQTSDEARANLETLLMWRAKLQKSSSTKQLVLIGPTQSGKSTLVNALVGDEVAKPSPRAGFTQDVFGFGLTEGHWAKIQQSQLPDWVVWDTPDFDSIHAQTYFEPLVNTIGSADLVLLVVSQEKYGDAIVWQWAERLTALGTPWQLVINKCDPDVALDLVGYAQAYITAAGGQHTAYWLPSFKLSEALWAPQLNRLRQRVSESTDALTPVSGQYVEQWIKPYVRQQLLADHWAETLGRVQRKLEGSLEAKLNEAPRPPALDRAMLSLVEKLDLPWLAPITRRVRGLITSPLKWFGRRQASTDQGLFGDLIDWFDNEIQLEIAAQSDVLTGRLGRARSHHAAGLEQAQMDVLSAAEAKISRQIDSSAQTLFKAVEEQPLVLNSLRTLKFGMDAGAIFATVKTLGVGAVELLFAPAVLAVTNTLTESAVGVYVDREADRLRRSTIDIGRDAIAQLTANVEHWVDFDVLPALQSAERHQVLEGAPSHD